MKLNEIKDNEGATKSRKRVGRGIGPPHACLRSSYRSSCGHADRAGLDWPARLLALVT